MAKVIVGLSGGVDSSVAAYLLQQQGHEVIGIFMKNWHDTEATISDDCPWEEDSKDALLVAEKLNIPFQTIDLSEAYKAQIVDYMFAEYKVGRTPNPDVLCNREIKFDVFLKKAMALGADYVATGHYVQKGETTVKNKKVFQLLSGADQGKDQSYFLCQLNQDQLSKALFPIGHLQKSEVRKIASDADLITAGKKDSQGLCFIGKVRLPDFLQQQLKPKKGQIIEIMGDAEVYQQMPQNPDLATKAKDYVYQPEMGMVVGEHNGAHYFTIGQRKGLQVGGKAEPLFVIGTDVKENIVYVGMGDQHPGLYKEALEMQLKDVHWIRADLKKDKLTVDARIRYRQKLQPAQLVIENETAYLQFTKAQRGITAGQFAAWYIDNELIGSGVIA